MNLYARTMTQDTLMEAVRPSGFLDYLPETYAARQDMLDTIARTFATFGFDAIETPMVEFRRILAADDGETSKQIFSVVNRDVHGEELALRFDHTVPFARLIAQNPYDATARTGIRLPWRRMVVGPVFRGERPQQGRYRQFMQFDADIAGTDEMIADAEIVMMMVRTMRALGVDRFRVRINHRSILTGLGAVAGLTRTDAKVYAAKMQGMLRSIDKLHKIGHDAVREQLQALLGDTGAQTVMAFLELRGTTDDILAQCRTLFADDPDALRGVEDIAEILTIVRAVGMTADVVDLDVTIARGLDYYTGTVMETTLDDAPQFGSVFSGGRYDGLVRRFTGSDLPAVGASIGVDRLFAALQSLGKDTATDAPISVVVLRIMPQRNAFYAQLADRIRMADIRTEIALLRDMTFQQQFAYALQSGARYAVICGEDEYARDVMQVKDLQTRIQEEVAIEEVDAYFSARITNGSAA